AANSKFGLKYISIENTHNIRMANPREEDGLAKHFVDILKSHPDSLEDFHSLPTEKAMLNSIDLRESSLAEKAFYLICVPNDLPFFNDSHCESRIVRFIPTNFDQKFGIGWLR